MNIGKIRKYQIFSIIITFILGTLFHFTYELSGNNPIVGIFSAINESVWEHLKLLFFPMVLTIIIGYFYIGKEVPNFVCAKTIGIVCSLLIMVVFFYTYTGVIGKNIAFVDIASFFIITAIGEFITYLLIINKFKCNNKLSVIILIIIFLAFFIFTFFPLNIGLFKDYNV